MSGGIALRKGQSVVDDGVKDIYIGGAGVDAVFAFANDYLGALDPLDMVV